MKNFITCVLILFLLISCFLGCKAVESNEERIKIKVLILPKFEVGEMAGDVPGEAQFYYEEYCAGGEAFDIEGGYADSKLYVKNGVALYLTGMGKVNAALSVSALVSDQRFDFSEAYVISTGCAGAAYEYGVMGDVYVITAAVDYDLGHLVDIRDMEEDTTYPVTWYYEKDYADSSCKLLNQELAQKVYDLVKDVKINTTELTRSVMASSFNNAEWAIRDPMVLKGTTATGDNYWKGIHMHNNAKFIVENYGCPDPFAVSEMEDVAIAIALERAGMLDRYIIIRDAVNMDVFINGDTPDSLWNPDYAEETSYENGKETVDIFSTAMENNFLVGRVVIDAILNADF